MLEGFADPAMQQIVQGALRPTAWTEEAKVFVGGAGEEAGMRFWIEKVERHQSGNSANKGHPIPGRPLLREK